MKKQDLKIYRVLDANANRLREALRVCEDVARFVIASNALAKEYKELRHRVTRLLFKLPVAYRQLIEERDSATDVGKQSALKDKKRESVPDILQKNLKRAEEAARVLEEFLKLLNGRLSAQFQKMRFEIYELEKKTLKKF